MPDQADSPSFQDPSIPSPDISSGEGLPRNYVGSLIVTIIVALFATTFIAQAFKIPSSSMFPALLVGDHLLVNKFVYGGVGKWYERVLPYRLIRRGDVIVFKYPYEDHPYYVKRVIALPGDRIRIAEQHVYIDGVALKEPYVVHDPSSADPYMFDFPPRDPFIISGEIPPEWERTLRQDTRDGVLLVPANQYFVLGDNRDHSSDSRYWGFVPRDAIVGRPLFVYWSLKDAPPENDASSVAQQLANLARDILDIPARTRWNRMFHEVY